MATVERRAAPARTCVQCRSNRDKRDLLRVVRTPGGAVVFDPTGRLNGRGAYVCRDLACVDGGVDKGGLRRALAAEVPAAVADELRQIVSRGTFDGA